MELKLIKTKNGTDPVYEAIKHGQHPDDFYATKKTILEVIDYERNNISHNKYDKGSRVKDIKFAAENILEQYGVITFCYRYGLTDVESCMEFIISELERQ